jgi:hypothetical protein
MRRTESATKRRPQVADQQSSDRFERGLVVRRNLPDLNFEVVQRGQDWAIWLVVVVAGVAGVFALTALAASLLIAR